MLLKSGVILLILSSMIIAMPRPLEDMTTSSTSTAVLSPDLMKTCYEQSECHCIKGVPICYNAKCLCLYSTSVDGSQNLPTNDTDTLNESQLSSNPL